MPMESAFLSIDVRERPDFAGSFDFFEIKIGPRGNQVSIFRARLCRSHVARNCR